MGRTIHDPRYETVIAIVRRERLSLRLTQAQVAARLQWPRSRISKMEIRERRLDLIETVDVCHALGLDLSAIVAAIPTSGISCR